MISDSTFNSSIDTGIRSEYVFNISISECIFASNGGTGIYFSHTLNSTIKDSIILYNGGGGIRFYYYTQYCFVFGNEIGWNGYSGSYCYDSGLNNTWDNGVDMGNWWSDYGGSGVFLIGGSAGSIDRFPMILDRYQPPITTTTTTYPTTYTYPTIPGSPTIPPVETYNGTNWYLQQILGIPIITLLGAGTGLITLLGIVVVFKRET